ncbi:hypothetical protein [Streptomyces sp. NPDC059080]|uniref:aromatic-ring hydroxylase C-terminal domain-containing protein n=1 Tax=Streptomyces sp. NPDC059080 TaxID=3346718 RepID=UPI0036740613
MWRRRILPDHRRPRPRPHPRRSAGPPLPPEHRQGPFQCVEGALQHRRLLNGDRRRGVTVELPPRRRRIRGPPPGDDQRGREPGFRITRRRAGGPAQLRREQLPGDHPLTGRSAPDLLFSDGTRLGDRLRSGGGLLLDLTDDAALRARAAGYADRVRVLTARTTGPAPAGLLVRPDGCTAWAVDAAPGDGSPASLDGLDDALRRWFGAPCDDPA